VSWREEYEAGLANTAAAIDRLADERRTANLIAYLASPRIPAGDIERVRARIREAVLAEKKDGAA